MYLYKKWAGMVAPKLSRSDALKKTAAFAPKMRPHLKEMREAEYIRAHRAQLSVEDQAAFDKMRSKLNADNDSENRKRPVPDGEMPPAKVIHYCFFKVARGLSSS